MRSIAFFLAASAVAINNVAGHYIFQQFSSGGTQYEAWKYIRRNSNPDWLQNSPVTDLASPDLRCNVGGGVANGTETLTIKAGSEFTFTLDTAVYHQGPISLYVGGDLSLLRASGEGLRLTTALDTCPKRPAPLRNMTAVARGSRSLTGVRISAETRPAFVWDMITNEPP